MKITAIGRQAFRYLKEEHRGSIVGVTSAGVFIKTVTDKILFLTTQPYKGPLTLNMEDDRNVFNQLENGMEVVMDTRGISIPALTFQVKTSQAKVWSPPLPHASPRSPAGRRESLDAFAEEILSFIKENDNPTIYAQLRTLARGDIPSAPQPEPLFDAIHNLHQNARVGDIPGARVAFNHLLGRGEGLTPAGDDLLLGWLLTLNRWREAFAPDPNLQILNQAILTAAYEKTTTLSTNLLVCATAGEADERLIAVLDALICEVNIEGDIVKSLLSWGSSSGLYAFLGMALSIILPL